MSFSKEVLELVKTLYSTYSDDYVCRQIHMHKDKLYKILQILNITPHNKQENRHLGNLLRKKTTMSVYGVENISKLENIKNKKAQTCKNHYGCENPGQSDIIKNKIRNKINEIYGVSNVFNLKEFQDLSKQIKKNKYGYEYYSQTQEYKDKYKQTSLIKYGVSHPSKNENIKNKVIQTKRKNNTFNISKPEDEYYKFLLTKYSKEDIFRQYKEERYPFSCDFYIKSLDLFIELNLHWSHGDHPFDKNNKEDLEKLKSWKEKDSYYYKNAIRVWTEKDIEKQKIAKENNLNYLIIYKNNYIII